MELIFEKSSKGRINSLHFPRNYDLNINLKNSNLLRKKDAELPEVSELQVVRHYTNLSRELFSIDTNFYPLGSCTMKYNPKAILKYALLPGFINRHPLAPDTAGQGFLACMYELQELLKDITGMTDVSLTPMAGAQGEFAGCLMIKAYHHDNKDFDRTEILIPTAAHGTNPATAAKAGFKVKEIPVLDDGDLDIEALKKTVGPNTAGIMLTNPSTLGLTEKSIQKIAEIVHQAGGLLYYDGANLNAIVKKVSPYEMGFDVMHMNLHKTFATPHGGGGPGAGPVAVNKKLAKYLPTPTVGCEIKDGEKFYFLQDKNFKPDTIGRLSTFMGNAGILLRAYSYIRLLGQEGLDRVSSYAVLNANYLARKLEKIGFELAYPDRFATHEFVVTLKNITKEYGVTALDLAKRLLDYGVHAPTIYFPLLIPECLLIEPTETESKEEIDNFIEIMKKILNEIKTDANLVKTAPHNLKITRVNEAKAAKELDLVFKENNA